MFALALLLPRCVLPASPLASLVRLRLTLRFCVHLFCIRLGSHFISAHFARFACGFACEALPLTLRHGRCPWDPARRNYPPGLPCNSARLTSQSGFFNYLLFMLAESDVTLLPYLSVIMQRTYLPLFLLLSVVE